MASVDTAPPVNATCPLPVSMPMFNARPLARTQLLDLPGSVSVGEAERRVEGMPGVDYVQPNYQRTATSAPNDPLLSEQWALDNRGQTVDGASGAKGADISAFDAWDLETGSAATTVAVVDTGIDDQHPDAGSIWSNPDEVAGNGLDDDGNGLVDDSRGWDFVDGDADPRDENGHGTHVAGIIGAETDNGVGIAGVAWDVSLMPLRVLDAAGEGTDAGIAEAFSYAAENGADIVNASLGGTGSSQILRDAVAGAPGTLFVVAAGNDATDLDRSVEAHDPCTIPTSNLICVAATDQSDRLADFSNYGASQVDLGAPGVNVISTIAAGTEVEVWSDDFEGTFDWVNGPGGRWGLTSEAYASPSHSLADSPGSDYADSQDRHVTSPEIDLRDQRSCRLSVPYLSDLGTGDEVAVEVSNDGTAFSRIARISGGGSGTLSEDLDVSGSGLSIRLRIMSDDSGAGDGVYVDDISVACAAGDGEYAIWDGTSMAAPQVAGAAALLAAQDPALSVAKLRSALLTGVETEGSLHSTTASGGRLDIANAFSVLAERAHTDTTAPRSRILAGPAKRTRSRTALIRFASSEAKSTFRCWLDHGPWRSCRSPRRLNHLGLGSHLFKVQATDPSGNRDRTPAEYKWRVLRKRA